MGKPAYALFKKNNLVDCFFSRSRAVRQVDEELGKGLFAPPWTENSKGDYEIVPCEVAYDKLYILPIKGKRPRMYESLEAIVEYLKRNNVAVKKKQTRPRTFTLTTDRGELKGRMIQVK